MQPRDTILFWLSVMQPFYLVAQILVVVVFTRRALTGKERAGFLATIVGLESAVGALFWWLITPH